jgi:hypothetical protein
MIKRKLIYLLGIFYLFSLNAKSAPIPESGDIQYKEPIEFLSCIDCESTVSSTCEKLYYKEKFTGYYVIPLHSTKTKTIVTRCFGEGKSQANDKYKPLPEKVLSEIMIKGAAKSTLDEIILSNKHGISFKAIEIPDLSLTSNLKFVGNLVAYQSVDLTRPAKKKSEVPERDGEVMPKYLTEGNVFNLETRKRERYPIGYCFLSVANNEESLTFPPPVYVPSKNRFEFPFYESFCSPL